MSTQEFKQPVTDCSIYRSVVQSPSVFLDTIACWCVATCPSWGSGLYS